MGASMESTCAAPIVSVVIPCFNLGKYLGEAVDSVLGQTLKETEIIVVDPGSTEEATRAILADFRRPRTTVVFSGRMRAGAARNLGISRARGRYICCLDADDILEPSCIEKCVAALDADEGIGIATFWFSIFGEPTGLTRPLSATLVDFLVENCACTAALFRREAWGKAGGYDEELEGYEDWDFWIGIMELGYRAHIIREPLFRYRDRADGKHRASDTGARRDGIVRRIMARHESSFRAHALEVIFGKDRQIGTYRAYWEYALNEAARARKDREAAEHELRALRASKAWRLGCAFRDARRSAGGLLALPIRLARALRGKGG